MYFEKDMALRNGTWVHAEMRDGPERFSIAITTRDKDTDKLSQSQVREAFTKLLDLLLHGSK